ncbi:hypothetical protein FN846DRAFT_955453 [Sphaerosporella brunnea]|uniref:Uncharacterized protein n=1 Tax=Sphaerosporella brunnea TaxID=1250544 RepID=A0A5J5ET84_9PEZI|nr:hypothetical protein FN846DRAFT_955453 [Sphaerosporella brunnea]
MKSAIVHDRGTVPVVTISMSKSRRIYERVPATPLRGLDCLAGEVASSRTQSLGASTSRSRSSWLELVAEGEGASLPPTSSPSALGGEEISLLAVAEAAVEVPSSKSRRLVVCGQKRTTGTGRAPPAVCGPGDTNTFAPGTTRSLQNRLLITQPCSSRTLQVPGAGRASRSLLLFSLSSWRRSFTICSKDCDLSAWFVHFRAGC